MGSSKRSNRGKKAGIAAKPRRVPRNGDERLKSLLELSSDWYWEQDERYRFTQIVGGAVGKSGFDSKNYLGKTRWDHGGEPVSDGGSWDQHKATLKARRPFTDFVFKRSDSNGELRYISSSRQPVLDDQGRFRGYRGIAKDVTQRVRAELRHTIEHGVTRILAQSAHIADAAPRILRLICDI